MNATTATQPAPQGEQQALAVLVLTSHEVTLVHQALGELPAKLTELTRAKIVNQAQNQQQVVQDLQKLIAEQAAPKSGEPVYDGNASSVMPSASNLRQLKSKRATPKQTAAPEPQAEPATVTEV